LKKHTRIYKKYFNLGEQDKIICEFCGIMEAVDIRHIEPKKMGGSKPKDRIDNLIALCRTDHNRAHGWMTPKISKKELKTRIELRQKGL